MPRALAKISLFLLMVLLIASCALPETTEGPWYLVKQGIGEATYLAKAYERPTETALILWVPHFAKAVGYDSVSDARSDQTLYGGTIMEHREAQALD